MPTIGNPSGSGSGTFTAATSAAPAITDNFAGVDASVLAAKNWAVTAAGTASATISLQRASLISGSTGGYNAADYVYLDSNVPVVTDAEMLWKLELGAMGTKERYHLLGLRANQINLVTGTAYILETSLSGDGTMQFTLTKKIAGVRTAFGAAFLNVSPTAGDKYFIRLRMQSSTFSAKVWANGIAEPATWTSQATDTSIVAAGKVVWHMQGSNAAATSQDYLHFGSVRAL